MRAAARFFPLAIHSYVSCIQSLQFHIFPFTSFRFAVNKLTFKSNRETVAKMKSAQSFHISSKPQTNWKMAKNRITDTNRDEIHLKEAWCRHNDIHFVSIVRWYLKHIDFLRMLQATQRWIWCNLRTENAIEIRLKIEMEFRNDINEITEYHTIGARTAHTFRIYDFENKHHTHSSAYVSPQTPTQSLQLRAKKLSQFSYFIFRVQMNPTTP